MTVIVSEIHPPYIEIDIQNLSFVMGMKINPFEIQILMLVIEIMTFESEILSLVLQLLSQSHKHLFHF